MESNAEKKLRKPPKCTSSRYGTETFELKEADLRAIVAVVLLICSTVIAVIIAVVMAAGFIVIVLI